MFLLDHVSITVRDIEVSRGFYDAVMGALGAEKVYDRPSALGYGVRCDADEVEHTFLSIYSSVSFTSDPKRHWCFKAQTRHQVDEFFRLGLENDGASDGEPGLRPQYHENYYAAFLLDPDGNRIEAVCNGRS